MNINGFHLKIEKKVYMEASIAHILITIFEEIIVDKVYRSYCVIIMPYLGIWKKHLHMTDG